MAKLSMTFLVALALSSNMIMLAYGNEFLKAPTNQHSESVSEEDIRVSLLDEVESSLGKGSASSRLSQMEAILRPIVAALAKNAHGKLEHSAVSYALHRLFVQRHGWVIRGLGPEAVALNSTSPTQVLKDQVPSFIESMFEKRLAGKGFGLHELAVLAATIEHLIHNEAVSRLGLVFNVHQLSVTGRISKDEATTVLDTYMMAYILAENLNNMTVSQALELNTAMPEVFLAWKDTQKFVEDVRKTVIKDDEDGADFASLAAIVEAVGEQFGSFQDLECQQMKESLKKMEYRGTGRVRLADFYKPALEGSWTFQESSGYLRSLGVLDESDPNHPSVMMVNYITSHSNCIASSGFYSVCCKNECEGLMGYLEEKIGTPEAKPGTIVALIPNAPSPFVKEVSASLLERLEAIAGAHMGTVPLHSRLFAQWLHYLFPRECPYPHMSGTADSRQLPEEWMERNGQDGTATEDEMKQHVARALEHHAPKLSSGQRDLAVEDLMPWSEEEELIVLQPTTAEAFQTTASLSASLRSMILLAASGSLAFAVIQALEGSWSLGLGAVGKDKHMV